MDEVRFSGTVREPEWIKASYETQRDDLLTFSTEEGVTSVATYAATDIINPTATLNGEVTLMGIGATSIINRAFVYDTVSRANPGDLAPAGTAYADFVIEAGTFGIGVFDLEATGLAELTLYYFRAGAESNLGVWAYGDEMEFFIGEEGKVYLGLRPDLDETKIRGQVGIPADAVVNNFVGYTLPIYNDDFQMLEFTFCIPERWDSESQVLIHVDYCLSVANESGNSVVWELIYDYATPNEDVIPALPGYESNSGRYIYSNNQYQFYQDWFVLDYDIRPADPMVAEDILTFKLRREAVGGQGTDTNNLIVFAVDVLFARGDFMADPEGNVFTWILEWIADGTLIGGESMYFFMLAIIPLGLLIAMMATKQSMLGFAAALFWFIFGAYCYTQSTVTWDINYCLGFGSMLGMTVLSMYGAYALREKRDTIADQEMDEDSTPDDDTYYGEDNAKENEEEGKAQQGRRTKALHERARERRTGEAGSKKKKKDDWGEFK